MGNRYGYAYEKFVFAMEIMATGKGSRAERLGRAFLASLRKLRVEHLPEEIREPFERFHERMFAGERLGDWDNSIDASVRKMHWKTAESMAQSLFEMFLVVMYARHERRDR